MIPVCCRVSSRWEKRWSHWSSSTTGCGGGRSAGIKSRAERGGAQWMILWNLSTLTRSSSTVIPLDGLLSGRSQVAVCRLTHPVLHQTRQNIMDIFRDEFGDEIEIHY